jgi:small subunit ribosomal protein S9
MSNSNEFLGTGRRKTSVARVRISTGSGKIQVNGRAFEVYFPLESQRMAVQQPFVTTATSGKYDVSINVVGGGPVGQAGAVRHGIARGLIRIDPALRPVLKKAGFLTRDSRVVERKKYGLAGARRRFQYSKR